MSSARAMPFMIRLQSTALIETWKRTGPICSRLEASQRSPDWSPDTSLDFCKLNGRYSWLYAARRTQLAG